MRFIQPPSTQSKREFGLLERCNSVKIGSLPAKQARQGRDAASYMTTVLVPPQTSLVDMQMS